jgi:GNAT superfamily N-acetyltransferase
MASAEPMRDEDGAGAVVPGGLFLGYLYVVPARWGEGIGGLLLDAVVAEALRHTYWRVCLWTHEDNDRSHRLYRGHGFRPTGRVADGEGEWVSDLSRVQPGESP